MNRLTNRIAECTELFAHLQYEKWGLLDANAGVKAVFDRNTHYMRGFTEGNVLKMLDEKESKKNGHDLKESHPSVCHETAR